MPAYTTENNDTGGRRQLVTTGGFVLLALVLNYLPGDAQQGVASLLRSTVLRPFVVVQDGIAGARVRATESSQLRARLDSMVAVVTAQTHLEEENRNLRGLLSLSGRIGAGYRAASVIRPGTAGSESMFALDVGAEDGVKAPAAVITRHGLVGLVREVRETSSIGIDWSHPAFRASATTLDGTTTGIVESLRGDFREQDRLVLNGTPFHTTLEEGTIVITSGLGGVLPRGIPIGRVRGLAEADPGWRRSYWLEPFTQPGNVTHVLVAAPGLEATLPGDVGAAWPEDSIATAETQVRREALRRDSLRILRDSLESLRAILRARRSPDSLRAPEHGG